MNGTSVLLAAYIDVQIWGLFGFLAVFTGFFFFFDAVFFFFESFFQILAKTHDFHFFFKFY